MFIDFYISWFYVIGEFEDMCCSVEKSEIQTVIPHNAGDAEFVCGADEILRSFGEVIEVDSVCPAEFAKHNTVAFFDYNPVNIPEDFIHFIFFNQCESVLAVEKFASVRRSVVAMY